MRRNIISGFFSLLLLCGCNAGGDDMYEGFVNPPAEARPRVWWHWEDGNVTKDGIRKDLDWMKRVGIGGFHHFDASIDMAPVVDDRLVYMQDGWKDAFRYAIAYADSLGMEMGIASSPGWSSTGGPWVEKEDAMKQLVWSVTDLREGHFKGVLEQPFTRLDHYRDIKVVALPLPESDGAVRAVTVVGNGTRGRWAITPVSYDLSLEASSDGVNFTRVALLPNTSAPSITVNVPATSAESFRLVNIKEDKEYKYILHTRSRVEHAEEKAGLSSPYDLNDFPTVVPEGETFPTSGEVVDLTACMQEDGTLEWDVPAGEWRVIRFGYTLTGKRNGPAPEEATGLEVDKMDPEAWDRYFHNYLEMYKDATGGLMGSHGIQNLLLDSFEAWWDTWTPRMEAEFEARRGYALLPWMPALSGEILVSPEATEKFLFDWRRTIGELHAANYERLHAFVEEYGLQNLYLESQENGRVYLVDGMDVKKQASIPMAACWAPLNEHARHSTATMAFADIKESASVANIYGRKYVSAESMTTDGYEGFALRFSPSNLKNVIDFEFWAGVSRVYVHESSHQPLDDCKPGLGLLQYGQWFTRHETWAEQAIAWTDYLARNCYMLSQGANVADILVYYGEDTNVTGRYGARRFPCPQGYNYDFINPSGLFDVCVKGGRIVAPSGASYAVLCLDNAGLPESEELRARIEELKAQGAVVCTRESLEAALEKTPADVMVEDGIRFVHRRTDRADIYWINKPSEDFRTVELSLRCSGRRPMAWNPVDGSARELSYRQEGGRTLVSLDMVPDDVQFVVLSGKAEDSFELPAEPEPSRIAVDGPWTLSFPGRTLEGVVPGDYADYPFEDVKYFSGTAAYSTTLTLDSVPEEAVLDLGEVHDLAEVFVNGVKAGIVWKKPFALDIAGLLKEGENALELRVINTWANRMVGDAQPDCPQRTTYFSRPGLFKADTPTAPAGLYGPVALICR